MMNFRLTQPSVLIDINEIAELSYIKPGKDGGMQIGAMARHKQVEHSDLIAERSPLIHETMPQIATVQIRSRGTIGGSIAHADPAAELAAVSIALDSRLKLISTRGERWVAASEFFLGMFTTSLEPDEMLAEIEVPAMAPNTGWALEEVARRPHDFSLVGVTAVLMLNGGQACQAAKMVFMSVGETPMEAHNAQASLVGHEITPDLISEAASIAASQDIDPGSDIHATADFRRHLAEVLARRALQRAYDRAQQ
jgi:CO/xanthine dehydrogenase FAD-binding subunit